MNVVTKAKSIGTGYVYLLTVPLLMVAFLLRFDHLLARVFHTDEFISMLAAQMTALKGAPILPSGLLYHQGLLLSYLAAPFVWLPGGSFEEMMRWPSLLAGVLTVAGFYLVGRRLFLSPATGLFALTLAALDMPMILWSARVRMYSLAGLFILLTLYCLTRGTFVYPRPRYRLAAAVCFLGAVLSHSVSLVVLPVWALAVLIVVILGRKRFDLTWYRRESIRPGALVLALAIIAVGVGLGVAGQIPFLSPTSAGTGGDSGGALAVFDKFLDPGVSWQRVDDYIYYYASSAYWPLTALAGLAMLMALAAAVRGQLTRRDLTTLFLGIALLLTIAELGLALDSTWRKSRYLFIVCQAPFLLLAADGLGRLGGLLPVRWGKYVPAPAHLGAVLGIAAILAFWGKPTMDLFGSRGTGGYDTSFTWVKEQWQEEDQVMTVHPSASYLYLGRLDYYAAQRRARVLADEESEELVDRYVGAGVIDSVEGLNRALAQQQGRLWFVVDDDRLFKRYEPLFVQQVFAQMDVVHVTGGVPVFLSRPYPRPVPPEPPVVLSASFGNAIQLWGYSIDFSAVAPDGTVQLVLYWRPQTVQFSKPHKVFVQIRNEHDEIMTQADHFILEGMLTNAVLGQLKEQGEWLRDTADIHMPVGLPAGTYRLLVGLYDPDTFERVPVIADESGENAVILETVTIGE